MLVVLIPGTTALPSATHTGRPGIQNRLSHYLVVYQFLNLRGGGGHLPNYTTDKRCGGGCSGKVVVVGSGGGRPLKRTNSI